MKSKSIIALIIIHAVCLAATAMFARHSQWPGIAQVLFIACLFCQIQLASIWAALSAMRWFWRGLVWIAVLGVEFFALIMSADVPPFMYIVFFALVAFVAVATLVPLLVIRVARASLRRIGEMRFSASDEGLQYSIRNVMLITVAVAAVLASVRLIRGVDWQTLDDVWPLIAVIAVCFGAISVATAWAMLGLRSWRPRALVVLLMSLLVGLIPPYAFNNNGREMLAWSLIALTNCAAVVGTLFLVRSIGYRLIRLDAPFGDSAVTPATTAPCDHQN